LSGKEENEDEEHDEDEELAQNFEFWGVLILVNCSFSLHRLGDFAL
jgi:hypothetical protein